MRIFFSFLIAGILFLVTSVVVQAGFFDTFIGNGRPDIPYDDPNLSLQGGVDLVESTLNGVETERTTSEYIQDVVVYLLSFISLLAVIYIIWAGFNILIGNGDEEKLKKSRQTIIYVVLGIILIWLAWPITNFIIDAVLAAS